jgi:hypothetical protein
MADKFLVRYAASALPIEQLEATDTSQSSRIVHSSIDKNLAGSGEADCGATASNVRYKDYTTTTSDVHLNTIMSATLTGIDLVFVKIREAGSTGTPDCTITFGTQIVSKLTKVDDCVLIRPSALAGSSLKFKSSGATEVAKIDIMWGLES